MEPSREVIPGIVEKPTSGVPFRYPSVSFSLSALGFVLFVIAMFFKPEAQPPWGYAMLAAFLSASIVSVIGFFRTKDKGERWMCVVSAFVAISPFLLYAFLIFMVLPFVLSGIGGPN